MKKSSLTISILLASMLLAACNTSDTNTASNETANEANTKEEKTDTNNPTNVNEEEKEEDTSENKSKSPSNQTSTEANEILLKKTIEFTFNNERFTAKTETVSSEQLGYTIQLAEGFTLTSEEPGSDIVFYTADSNYSMRVKYYSQADNSYDTLLTNVQNLMIASTNNNFETVNIEQSAYDIHKGTQFISVDEASDLQTIAAIFEKGDKIVEITIFDGPENTLKDAFLQMAYTIQ